MYRRTTPEYADGQRFHQSQLVGLPISPNDAGKLVLLTPHNGAMDDAVRDYLDAIAPEHRPLFDRLHRLVLDG